MIRTQIYLPEEMHANLLKIAKEEGTTLSTLIREGASEVIKKKYSGMTPQQKALKFFADYPDSLRIKLSDSAVNLVRRERD